MKRIYVSRQVNAYMSLEASFIIGWVVFILTFLIYLSFYSYDRCILFQDTYAIAFRTSQKPLSKEQKQEYANAKIDTQFGMKYVTAKRMEKSISIKGNKVIASAKLNVMPTGSLRTVFMPNSGWNLSSTVEVEIINPTEIIRGFRKAESLLIHE